jgi:hypothetical protein
MTAATIENGAPATTGAPTRHRVVQAGTMNRQEALLVLDRADQRYREQKARAEKALRARNDAVIAALAVGVRQARLAERLGLTEAAIRKIVRPPDAHRILDSEERR